MFFGRKSQKRNNLSKKCRVEKLEARELMAGDVWASVVNGTLRVSGDNSSNGVIIEQVGYQTFKVAGSYQSGATRVNGSYAERYFQGVYDDIEVSLNGGNDSLRLGGTSESTRDILPDDVRINMGDGDDYVRVQWLSNRDYNDNISINTGWGNDTVSAYKVVCRNNMTIDTAQNWDTVDLNYITVGNRLNVYTGAGNDRFNLNQAIAYQVYAEMGSENDTVSIRNNSFTYLPTINGGSGSDTLNRFNNNKAVNHSFFEWFSYNNL